MQRRNVAAPARADFFFRKDLGFRAFIIIYLCVRMCGDGMGEGTGRVGGARARALFSPSQKPRYSDGTL